MDKFSFKGDMNFFSADMSGKLELFGSKEADLFTTEIKESFDGVLSKNYVKDNKDGMAGFVSASVDGRPWTGTMWTRDAGVFLRELVLWGYYEHASQLVCNLITLVQKNEEGFYTFPERFDYGRRASGHELDGTGAIIIGMVLLWERLSEDHWIKHILSEFLTNNSSPVKYIVRALSETPLIPGTGEFGGGCGIPGLFHNVVQNSIVRLALLAAAGMARRIEHNEDAEIYYERADTLQLNIEKYFTNDDGTWIWCLDPQTLKPDLKVVKTEINKGFGGINGVISMQADVLGFESMLYKNNGCNTCLNTFQKLFNEPNRREQFDKYGIWTQFDEYCSGMLSSPSYGHGYALQAMILFNKMEMADKALNYLINATYSPPEVYKLDRESKYHFYERFYSPDAIGKIELEQGCGTLNLVNVAEPLKVARLIIGIDDHAENILRIIPRVPKSIIGFHVKNWPVKVGMNLLRIDMDYEKLDSSIKFELHVNSGLNIPSVVLRLGNNNYTFTDVTKIEMCMPMEDKESGCF